MQEGVADNEKALEELNSSNIQHESSDKLDLPSILIEPKLILKIAKSPKSEKVKRIPLIDVSTKLGGHTKELDKYFDFSESVDYRREC